MTVYALLIVALIFAILAGFPVGWAIGIVSFSAAAYFFDGFFDIRAVTMLAQKSFYGVNNFTLLAVPFFLLAGRLMNTGGITTRLFTFTSCLVRPLRGGLAHANILASMLFAGMSGSAVADAAGLGVIEMRAMLDEGYDREFSAGVTAASSLIGPIIPPSIAMVAYGVVGEVSIAALFLGGVVPGILMALSQMFYVAYQSRRKNYPSGSIPPIGELLKTFARAFLALLTPVIILGGIYSGVFTPTEASSVAVIYAIILGIAIYKEYNFSGLLSEFRACLVDSATIMIIVAFVTVFGTVMIRGQIPMKLAAYMMTLTAEPKILLILFCIFWMVVGCFMMQTPATLILTPILLPAGQQFGIDPVHFGIVMILTLTVGQLTPPIGMVLYALVKVAKVPFERLVIITLPYVALDIGVILLLIIFPDLVLFLPRLLGYQ